MPCITGINLNKILLEQALGIDNYKVQGKGVKLMKKSVVLTFLDLEEGKVIRKVNLDEVTAYPYVLKFRMIFKENEMVESIENCASRHSMLALMGDHVEESMKNLQHFKSNLSVQYY